MALGCGSQLLTPDQGQCLCLVGPEGPGLGAGVLAWLVPHLMTPADPALGASVPAPTGLSGRDKQQWSTSFPGAAGAVLMGPGSSLHSQVEGAHGSL